MAGKRNNIAFVVVTKNRATELRRMLGSLVRQSYPPDQVILVDSGDLPVEGIQKGFPDLRIEYLRCIPPSGTRQRNEGLKRIRPEITLVGFLDDDVVLGEDALCEMMRFWEDAPEDIGGAAFNLINHPPLFASWLKSLPFVERLGLYSRRKGIVLPSGFHTMIGHVSETTFVKWLPTTAVTWQRIVFDTFQFDEWFEGYSYLEDLDFSYRVGKKFGLAVVGSAGYRHYPASTGRGSGYEFGRREIRNRIYFVRKHPELSLPRCFGGLFIRMLISLFLASRGETGYYVRRVQGNAIGLAHSLWRVERS